MNSAQESMEYLMTNVYELLAKGSPIVIRKGKTFKPWFNSDLIKQYKYLQRLRVKSKKSLETREKYILVRQVFRKMIEKSKAEFENSFLKFRNKSFFSYVNKYFRENRNLPALQSCDGFMVYDDLIKSNMLNSYFASVFEKELPFPKITA